MECRTPTIIASSKVSRLLSPPLPRKPPLPSAYNGLIARPSSSPAANETSLRTTSRVFLISDLEYGDILGEGFFGSVSPVHVLASTDSGVCLLNLDAL
jgi:hypothetical protein